MVKQHGCPDNMLQTAATCRSTLAFFRVRRASLAARTQAVQTTIENRQTSHTKLLQCGTWQGSGSTSLYSKSGAERRGRETHPCSTAPWSGLPGCGTPWMRGGPARTRIHGIALQCPDREEEEEEEEEEQEEEEEEEMSRGSGFPGPR
ncbi:unnamed protein product [Prorocentrum cordatum]|uniref:Uncharacterized protein n=1 Tax=Prorocentrum cordatum TaxID=2364126 RepID=A0ABN9PBT6_9DINO|nr:unnamed protein product [Polarella glacialis]